MLTACQLWKNFNHLSFIFPEENMDVGDIFKYSVLKETVCNKHQEIYCAGIIFCWLLFVYEAFVVVEILLVIC